MTGRQRRGRQEPETPAARGTTKCGWCLTGDHHQCKPYIEYYSKKWHCTCDCKGKRRE